VKNTETCPRRGEKGGKTNGTLRGNDEERERETRRTRTKSKTANRPVCCNNIPQGAFVKASFVHMAAICHRLWLFKSASGNSDQTLIVSVDFRL